MRRNLLLLTLLASIVLFVIMNHQYKDTVHLAKQTLKSNGDYAQKLCVAEGTLVDYNLENKTFVIKLSKVEGHSVQLKWQIKLKDTSILEELVEKETYHIKIEVDLNQHQFTAFKNRYAFDYDAYLFANNIKGQYFLVSLIDADACRTACLDCFRLKIRTWIQNQLALYFNEAQGGFLHALLLGEKSQFEQYEHYKNLGLAHVFAISGLHFGVIYQYFRKILAFKSAILRSVIILSFMAFLLLLVGGAYSAQRAFFMILYAEVCQLLQRKIDVYTNIATSLLIILILQPVAILSTGLHLSYFAYICVAIIYRKVFGKALKSKVLEAVRFSIGIQILLLPATLYYFQSANLYGFLSNALIVPMSNIILPLSMLFLIATSLNFGILVWPLSKILMLTIDLFYFIGKYLPLNLNYFVHFKKTDFYALLLYVFCLTFALIFWKLFLKRKWAFKWLLVIVLAFFVTLNFSDNGIVSISFFDVGHGDMSLIQQGQTAILIDTGDGRLGSNQLLRSRGVHDLDVLILSHAHADHIGDAIELMQNMAIGHIYMNQATYDKLIAHEDDSKSSFEYANASKGDANASNDDSYESVQDFLNRQSITILETPIEQIYETHGDQTMTLSILPIKGKSGEEDPNDDALAVALEYDGSLGYFLGDISTSLIDVLLATQSEKIAEYGAIDFIKSAHHGSKTAINLNLYTNYGIDYVVTSCSTKYKMPNVKLEGILKEQGIKHYTTYESGEIDMILSRETIKIKQFLW